MQIEERQKNQKFRNFFYLDEIFLQRGSKATWIQLGEDNTKYVHSIIKHNRLQQAITQIKDEHKILQTRTKTVAEVFVDYYELLFGNKGEGRGKALDIFMRHGYLHILNNKWIWLDGTLQKRLNSLCLVLTLTKAPTQTDMVVVSLYKSGV